MKTFEDRNFAIYPDHVFMLEKCRFGRTIQTVTGTFWDISEYATAFLSGFASVDRPWLSTLVQNNVISKPHLLVSRFEPKNQRYVYQIPRPSTACIENAVKSSEDQNSDALWLMLALGLTTAVETSRIAKSPINFADISKSLGIGQTTLYSIHPIAVVK